MSRGGGNVLHPGVLSMCLLRVFENYAVTCAFHVAVLCSRGDVLYGGDVVALSCCMRCLPDFHDVFLAPFTVRRLVVFRHVAPAIVLGPAVRSVTLNLANFGEVAK